MKMVLTSPRVPFSWFLLLGKQKKGLAQQGETERKKVTATTALWMTFGVDTRKAGRVLARFKCPINPEHHPRVMTDGSRNPAGSPDFAALYPMRWPPPPLLIGVVMRQDGGETQTIRMEGGGHDTG